MAFDLSSLSLPNFQSASLATVDPNPTVVSQNQSSTLSNLSQLANVAGQWGATIASIVSGRTPTVAPNGTGLSTVPGQVSNGTMTIILLGVVVLVVVLVARPGK